MKEFKFSGVILVASKQLADGPFKWIATYKQGNTNKVDVIAFECIVKEQIPGKVKELISVLSKKTTEQPATETAKQNLSYLKNLDNMLNSGLYQKDLPQDLLRAVRRNFPLVAGESCIYLSGIESIS